jgi:hypothetical protein
MLAALALVPLVLAGAVGRAGARADAGGPFPLVTLASLGTVTWRCNPHDLASVDRHGLGFRALPQAATESVRLFFGRRLVATRRLDPSQSTTFPQSRSRVQTLRIVQATEAGTLRATVRVDFLPGRTYCWPYFPPRADVTLLPR